MIFWQGALAVFLITLGLGQLTSTYAGLRAASLVGPSRLAGYGLGLLLLVTGALILPNSWLVLAWALPAGPLALVLLLLAGSYIAPPPHPDCLFEADHPAHGSCLRVQIPDGEYVMPGYLLTPSIYSPRLPLQGGVLVVHGAGDTKTSYKWRLIQALLAEGLIVLTIDLPGHGDYRHRLLTYPDCLSAIPAALQFLREQPGVRRVGLAGISLGSAMALKSLAQELTEFCEARLSGAPGVPVDAFVALETPIELQYSRALYYKEMWHAYRAPVLSLLQEITVKQLRQSWFTGGYRSQHNTAELIALLNPVESIAYLKGIPTLIVYGGRDTIAPRAAALALQQAAAGATLLEVKGASHVTLTLIPEVNRQVARWLRENLVKSGQ